MRKCMPNEIWMYILSVQFYKSNADLMNRRYAGDWMGEEEHIPFVDKRSYIVCLCVFFDSNLDTSSLASSDNDSSNVSWISENLLLS